MYHNLISLKFFYYCQGVHREINLKQAFRMTLTIKWLIVIVYCKEISNDESKL